MPKRIALTLNQNNDEDLPGTVTKEDTGQPQDLTGVTLEMYLKASASADDSTATVLSSAAPGGITITNAAAGTYTVAIPDSALTAAGTRWYRVDAVSGPTRKTVVYGPLRVRDL